MGYESPVTTPHASTSATPPRLRFDNPEARSAAGDVVIPTTVDYYCALCRKQVLADVQNDIHKQLKHNIICSLCLRDITAIKYYLNNTSVGLPYRTVELGNNPTMVFDHFLRETPKPLGNADHVRL